MVQVRHFSITWTDSPETFFIKKKKKLSIEYPYPCTHTLFDIDLTWLNSFFFSSLHPSELFLLLLLLLLLDGTIQSICMKNRQNSIFDLVSFPSLLFFHRYPSFFRLLLFFDSDPNPNDFSDIIRYSTLPIQSKLLLFTFSKWPAFLLLCK